MPQRKKSVTFLDAFHSRAYGLTCDELRYIPDPADANPNPNPGRKERAKMIEADEHVHKVGASVRATP